MSARAGTLGPSPASDGSGDIKKELKMAATSKTFDNCIKSMIKGKKRLMAMEFEPSKELTATGADCYKIKSQATKVGAFAMIPCGVYPRINQCAPDGIISPATCVYYSKWLDF